MQPIVDGLEQELQGRLNVIRLDMQGETGKIIGSKYGFRGTPTFILFGPEGKILLHQVGSIDPESVHKFLD